MTAVAEAAVRAWFDKDGWQLEPTELRVALKDADADDDLTVELLDEGADRRRAQPSKPPAAAQDDTRRPPSNGAAGRPRLTEPDRGASAPVPKPEYVPPQNLEAEESVLGAMMMSPAACEAVAEILRPDGSDFYRESHALVYRAALALAASGEPVDAITLTYRLDQTGKLEKAGGRVRLHELAALVPASANASHYARIVAETAERRAWIRAGGELARIGWEGVGDNDELRERVRSLLDGASTSIRVGPPPEAVDAGSFVFDEPTELDQIRLWGDDTMIGWAAGEGLMLLGPDGVGKTTLGQQLALARAGIRSHVLGMAVAADERRVLYIAADRPRQAARSMRRMVGNLDRTLLADRVTVWKGPLQAMLNEDRTILARLAKQFDCGTIIVDSLKDVAVDLAKDDAGGRIAACFQHLIATGVELLVLHHPRKPEVGNARAPRELSDAYGSRLIYGVMGSVVLLWGQPGDAIVELRHLKTPIDEIGPWNIRHDHSQGHSTIERGTDLLQLVLNASTAGLTASAAAGLVYEKEAPTRNEVDRVRRRLEKLADNGKVVKMPGQRGGLTGSEGSTYLYNGPAEALQ